MRYDNGISDNELQKFIDAPTSDSFWGYEVHEVQELIHEIKRLKQTLRDSMIFLADHSGTVDHPRRLTLEELEELYGFMKASLR